MKAIPKKQTACEPPDETYEVGEEACETSRGKDKCLALVAHELRNPLTVIRNVMHSLRWRHTGTPEVEWGCDVVAREVEQMSRLIDDLLDVSRGNRAKVPLCKKVVNLTTIATEMASINSAFLDLSRHHLKVQRSDDPVWVEADPSRLEQILTNLLNNAARYTPSGGRIELIVERDGDTAILRVTDTGIGIAPEMLRRIFDPFVRTRQARNHAPGGLGLGLTLVRDLVELHGGSIEAASDGLGQGSVFTVRLPVLASHSSTAPLHPPSGSPGITMRPLRILMADDNRALAETWATLLTGWGHIVEVVYNGLAALENVRRQWPEVVLLDIDLPDVDGYQVARRLRREDAQREVLLVAMTGYGQEENRRRAREAGFDLYLIKPVEVEQMRELLTHPLVLAGRGPKDESTTEIGSRPLSP